MTKPDKEEIRNVVELAGDLASDNTEVGRLARCFLYFHGRNLDLEAVYEDIEHYLRSGMAEQEHARLLETLQHARAAEHRREHEDQDESLGLD